MSDPVCSRVAFPNIGKRPERIRVSVSHDMLTDISRECQRHGYKEPADWVFDAVLEKLYGQEYVRRLYEAEAARIAKLLASAGQTREKNVPNGGNP